MIEGIFFSPPIVILDIVMTRLYQNYSRFSRNIPKTFYLKSIIYKVPNMNRPLTLVVMTYKCNGLHLKEA